LVNKVAYWLIQQLVLPHKQGLQDSERASKIFNALSLSLWRNKYDDGNDDGVTGHAIGDFKSMR